MKLAFLDCETTGLEPTRHEIWELAFIIRSDEASDGETHEYQLPVDLTAADPNGLRVGRFYERRDRIVGERGEGSVGSLCLYRSHTGDWISTSEAHIAHEVAVSLDGAHLVGAVPSFDASFLTPWLRRHGHAACWHYHLVDVEVLAAAHVGAQPPWNSVELSRRVGVDPDEFDRHTALGDAKWAEALYDAVLGIPS